MKTIQQDQWVKTIVYAAGMQGACSQKIADTVIEEVHIIHEATEQMIEVCAARAMLISNNRGESKFSDALINWLHTN